MDTLLVDAARALNEKLAALGYSLATAESCTGGLLSAAITSVPGSSAVFLGGVTAYSNYIKTALLGVAPDTLECYGAVSEQTVREMVAGVRRAMNADCALATSGIAGPGGGTPDKPVGTVWIAASVAGRVQTLLLRLDDGGREVNMRVSAEKAMALLSDML